jgi:hypothetical protein
MKINKSMAAAAAAMLLGGVANAQTSAVHTVETLSNVYNSGDTFLDKFTLQSGMYKINSVGLYNIAGVAHSVEVRKNGNLVETISGATGASGLAWKYANLTAPIIMSAGDNIEILFSNASGTQSWGYATQTNPAVATANPDFTVVSKYAGASGASYNTLSTSGLGWTKSTSTLGGNAVPEPGEWAAMGILGAGLAGLVIRKRRNG